ncbi:uncharacterized protein LOC106167714 isoform X2 [Lingula anatina]|uniref:Uncharacterized protein LOC106167714 isoform X2 n=1 Tax=Lingula anatina TaxID=7574 RepID=A0A1S3IUZ2_LINAN|nr:uncharacterized protein LOC106167714 isoform X2 [Lingula anatina]|eukprot:XP_013402020.1 uncharacterized protein LOC106167714 isoform X2 [Lingula anatina]
MSGATEITIINETSKDRQPQENCSSSVDNLQGKAGKIDYLKEYKQKYGIKESSPIKNIESKREQVVTYNLNTEDLITKYLRDKSRNAQFAQSGFQTGDYPLTQTQLDLFHSPDNKNYIMPNEDKDVEGIVDGTRKSKHIMNESSKISQYSGRIPISLSESSLSLVANVKVGENTSQQNRPSPTVSDNQDGSPSTLSVATAKRQLFAQQGKCNSYDLVDNVSEGVSKSLPPTPEKWPRGFDNDLVEASSTRSSLSKSNSEPERLVPWKTKFHIPSFEEFKLRRKYGGSVPNIAGIVPDHCSNDEMVFPSSFSMTTSSSTFDLKSCAKDRQDADTFLLKGSRPHGDHSDSLRPESPTLFGQTYTLNSPSMDLGVKSYLRTSPRNAAVSPSTSDNTASPQSSWEIHVQALNPTVPKIMTKTGQSVERGHCNSPRGYKSMQKLFGQESQHHRSKSLDDQDSHLSKTKIPSSLKEIEDALHDADIQKEKLRRCKSDKSCQSSPRVTFSDEIVTEPHRRRKSKSDLGNVAHLLEQAGKHDNDNIDKVKHRKHSRKSQSQDDDILTLVEASDRESTPKDSSKRTSKKHRGKSKSDLGTVTDVVKVVQHQQLEEQMYVPSSSSSSRQKPKRHVKEEYEKYLRKYQMDNDCEPFINRRNDSVSHHPQPAFSRAKSDNQIKKIRSISKDDSEIPLSYDNDEKKNETRKGSEKKKKGKSKPPPRPHSSLGLSSGDATFLPSSVSEEGKDMKCTAKKDQEQGSAPIKQNLYTKKKDYKVSIEPDLDSCMAITSTDYRLDMLPRDNSMFPSSPRHQMAPVDFSVSQHQRLGDVEMLDLDLSSLESDLECSEHTLPDVPSSSRSLGELDDVSFEDYGLEQPERKEEVAGTSMARDLKEEISSAENSPRPEMTTSPRFNNYVEALQSGYTAPRSEDLFTKYSKRFKRLEQTELSQISVTRSTSDVSDIKEEKKRKKDKKLRHNKSDPFDEVALERQNSQKEQRLKARETRGSKKMSLKAQDVSKRKLSSATSKEEILSFLQEVQTGSFKTLEESSSLQSLEEIYEDDTSSEDTPKGAEVERVDSGVGSETKAGMKKKSKGPVCEDCNKTISVLDLEDCVETLCTKCHSRRVERKETIQELVDTELSYGRDLRIIKEEFMSPMKTASLLTPEQLDTIFINLEELIDINDKFADKLQDLVELANEQGDEDYVTVYIGQLFLESSNMFLAFENYCVKQVGQGRNIWNIIDSLD